MQSLKPILLALICLIFTGCAYKVTLAVKNSAPAPAPPALNITAITKDKSGQQTGTIGLGTVNPGQTSTKQTFSVKNGGSYSVTGSLASGFDVFSSGVKTVNTNLPNELVEITAVTPPTVDANDVSAIEQDFGQLGANVGFIPMTVSSALGSLFGGLVWYVETSDPRNAETQLVMVISPSQLTGAVALADFQYPEGPALSHDEDISTDASVKAAGSIPLWGSLTGGFSANSVYKTHWSLVGYGNVTKTDTVSFQDKLLTLSAAQKNDICSRLQTPKSHVMYVNEMFVVKTAVLSYQKGTALSANAALSAGSIVSGSTAYDFSSSSLDQSEVDDVVVNVQGPTFASGTLAFCNAAPPPPATQPTTAQPVAHISNLATAIKDTMGQNLPLMKANVLFTSRAPR
jgi:hypothetical protein